MCNFAAIVLLEFGWEQKSNFHQIWIVMEKSLMKWVPDRTYNMHTISHSDILSSVFYRKCIVITGEHFTRLLKLLPCLLGANELIDCWEHPVLFNISSEPVHTLHLMTAQTKIQEFQNPYWVFLSLMLCHILILYFHIIYQYWINYIIFRWIDIKHFMFDTLNLMYKC